MIQFLLRILWKILKKILQVLFVLLILFFVWFFLQTPSLDRNWTLDQKVLATFTFEDNFIYAKNLRNFDYRTTDDYDPGYYDETFDLDKIERVWFIVEPFSENVGPAHTMLTFDFSDGKYVSVSAEIRKEVGESFDPWRGLAQQYEVVYMVGHERDLIRLRSNYRKDDVYMYPIRTSPEKVRLLFVDVISRAQKLATEPEFYNTLTNTCTTTLRTHANKLTTEKIPFSWKLILPYYSDEILYDMDLIETELSFSEAKEYYRINDAAMSADQDEDFSQKIRPEIR